MNLRGFVEALRAGTLLRGGTRHDISVPKEGGFYAQDKVPTRFSILAESSTDNPKGEQ
jgi:hypothetical protein